MFDAVGAPRGAKFLVTDTAAGLQWQPTVTAYADGFVVGWTEGEAAARRIRARSFAADGMPVGASVLVSTAEALGGVKRDLRAVGGAGASHATVAVHADGDLQFSWVRVGTITTGDLVQTATLVPAGQTGPERLGTDGDDVLVGAVGSDTLVGGADFDTAVIGARFAETALDFAEAATVSIRAGIPT